MTKIKKLMRNTLISVFLYLIITQCFGGLIITAQDYTEVPLLPHYPNSNKDWWLYQFEGYPSFTNHNCGPTSSAMIINYLKGKSLTTKYNSFIYANIPNVHCTARGYYCQDYLKAQGYPEEIYSEGYAKSDWSYPGAADDQIQNALSLEGIKSHIIKGEDYKDAEAYLKNLEDAVSKGSACIACVNPKEYVDTKITSHWTVIYGYNNTHILLNDPGWGRFKKEHPISKSNFAKALWNAEPKSWREAIIIDTSLEAKPVLTSPLRITPEKDKYYVRDTLRAEFTIKNIGGAPITLDKLLVGGRFNDAKLPNGEYPDFTSQSTTLQQDDQYRYNGTLTPTQPGNYQFFIAYYIENPTPEEKKLLDENNWNTCVGLGEGLTDADRIEDIRVFPQLERNVLSVPDGHPTIQAAVDAASAGDTIIVKDGIYYENVDVTKSLTIRSTSGNPANMIVQAKYPDDHVFYVTADNVNISGFTVKGATGHYLRKSKGSGYCGLDLYKAKYCNIFDIIACENHFGIFLNSGSNKNTLTGNEVFNNTNCGIAVYSSSNNNLINNNALSNKYGIAIYTPASSNNTLINNNAFYNYYGIYLRDSNNNKIYLNSFIDNSNNVYSYSSTNIWNSKEKLTYIYRGNTYTNYLGNYWSDYVGYDADNNGIGDSHYPIENDKDKYPLMTVSGRYFNPSPTISTPPTSTLTPAPRPTLTLTLAPRPTLTPAPRPTLRPTARAC